MLTLSEFLTALLSLVKGILSHDAPENAAATTLTSRSTKESDSHRLRIKRNPARATVDGLFGDMDYDGKRICFTMERTAVAIPEGIYSGCKRDSQHLPRKVVGISVPNRTDIECHPANHPCQLEGCIAVGESIDNDALDNSTKEFDVMMAVLPDSFMVEVCH